MKHAKFGWAMILIAGGLFLATGSLAMDKHAGHDMAGKNHDDMQQMQGMQGMNDMQGMKHTEGMQGMQALPAEQEVEGVKAMFHLMPIDLKVMPAGQQATHHLMVMFNDAKSGKQLAGGTVAVKITDPGQVEAKPVKMMGMQGHFGVDVNLDRPGVWHFRIAAKMADGKVRQFHSHYVVK